MRYLLSIDPGSHSGWAFWSFEDKEARLLAYGRTVSKAKDIQAEVTRLKLMAMDANVEEISSISEWSEPGRFVVVAEDQFFRGDVKKNIEIKSRKTQESKLNLSPRTTSQVMANRIRWETVSELNGFTVDAAIQANSWQRRTLGLPAKSTRKERKRMAQDVVKTYFGVHVNQDTVDAICLGMYYLRYVEGGAIVAVQRRICREMTWCGK